MKKILVLGVGAQGSTVAQRLDEEQAVSEIICADYDEKAVDGLVKTLKKAKGMKVDASDYKSIVKAAQGVDLMVNALPTDLGKNALDAALEVKTNYQDFTIQDGLVETDDPQDEWLEGAKVLQEKYGTRFAEIGKLAVVGTGSAPGLICVLASRAVRELDTCETIITMVYEGAEAKRFLPFWWSPFVALSDMADIPVAFEDGKFTRPAPYSNPIKRRFPEMGNVEVELVEHLHDEPIYIGLNADKFFKGVKNAYFKYGGSGLAFAKPLYRAGLLSQEEEIFQGKQIVPFDFVLSFLPPAPKFKEEIKEILDEGLVADTGAFVVEAYGKKDGKDVLVDIHLMAPGMMDSFEKAGLTGEMYLTGQGGFFFTKMLVEDRFPQKGLITSDMLNEEQVDYYLSLAADKDITYSLEIKDI